MSTPGCPPPIRSRTYPSPPSGEQYNVGGKPGGFTNLTININPPRHTILLQGNDGGGSTSEVFLSFVPIQENPTTHEPVVGGNGTFKAFHFTSLGGGGQTGLSFRKRIGGIVYISSFDTGQPGSFDWFLATDDFASIGIVPDKDGD